MKLAIRFGMLLGLLLVAVTAQRCVREIIIDLPDEAPKIVAISHFTEGQPFKIEVSISQPLYADGDAEVPEEADVTISKNGQLLDKLQRAYDDGDRLYWLSRESAVAGQEYSMIVRIAGMTPVEATSAVPKHAGLAPITVFPGDISSDPIPEGKRLLRVPLVLEIEDMPETNRYFAFGLQYEMVNYDDPSDPVTYQGSAYFLADGRTLSLLHDIPESVVLINEKFWNDNRRTIFLDALIPYDPATEKPKLIFVEWRTLSPEFYRYHLSLSRQGNNLPLSDPDAIYNNVIGGYGSFSGYSVSVDTVQIDF